MRLPWAALGSRMDERLDHRTSHLNRHHEDHGAGFDAEIGHQLKASVLTFRQRVDLPGHGLEDGTGAVTIQEV